MWRRSGQLIHLFEESLYLTIWKARVRVSAWILRRVCITSRHQVRACSICPHIAVLCSSQMSGMLNVIFLQILLFSTNSIVFYADTPSSAGELTPVVRMANVRASPSPKVSMMRTSSSGEMKLKPLATGASAAVYPADRARRLPALSPLGNYEACLPDLSLHHVYRPRKLFFETTLLIADYWVCFRYVSFLQLEDRTRRCYPVPPWGRYLSAARAAARS